MDADERKLFDASVEHVRTLVEQIEALEARRERPRVPGQGSCCGSSASRCPKGRAGHHRRPRRRRRRATWAATVVVVKAQVHAGGRGQGRRVKLAEVAGEAARQVASEILGMTLRHAPDRPEGKLVRKVYVEAGSRDRARAVPGHRARPPPRRASPSSPRPRAAWRSRRSPSDPREDPHRARRRERRPPGLPGPAASASGSASTSRSGEAARDLPGRVCSGCSPRRTPRWRDQPAGGHEQGDLLALDAKLNFDDNALYRHAASSRELHDPGRGGRPRARGQRDRSGLRRPGREHRLHGERRRPGHGDPGHDPGLRGRPGQLPRRGRRRRQGEGEAGLQADPARREREARSWSTSSAASCAAT